MSEGFKRRRYGRSSAGDDKWIYNYGNLGKSDFLLTKQQQASSYKGVAPTFRDNGVSFTGSLTYANDYTSGAILFANKYDLTKVNSILYDVQSYAKSPVMWVGKSSTGSFNSNTSASATINNTGILSLDVKSLRGEYYIGIKFAMTKSMTVSVTIDRIGFE